MSFTIAETIVQVEARRDNMNTLIALLESYPADDPFDDEATVTWEVQDPETNEIVELGTATKHDDKWDSNSVVTESLLELTGDDWDELAIELAYRGINYTDITLLSPPEEGGGEDV